MVAVFIGLIALRISINGYPNLNLQHVYSCLFRGILFVAKSLRIFQTITRNDRFTVHPMLC